MKRGLHSGQLKGDGQLASTKWCMSTLACFLKRIYTEKKLTLRKCIHEGVGAYARFVWAMSRARLLARTLHIAGFFRTPRRSLGRPHNSTPLSRICKMSAVLDSATPK